MEDAIIAMNTNTKATKLVQSADEWWQMRTQGWIRIGTIYGDFTQLVDTITIKQLPPSQSGQQEETITT